MSIDRHWKPGNRRHPGRWVRWARLSSIAVALAAWPAAAQPPAGDSSGDGGQATPQTHPNNPTMWNVDQMMEDAVRQIARRYNLNKAQENYTRLILRKRVLEFLKDREPEIRELLKESIDMRMGLKEGTADVLAKWAGRARPIYQDAMQAILEGNAEWRDILNDEQKKVHDADLAQMDVSFKMVNQQLDGWIEGKGFAPTTNQPRVASGEAGKEQAHRVSKDPKPVTRVMEDLWEQYVNKFIAAYALNDAQTASARGVHKDELEQARKYRESRQADFVLTEGELNRLGYEAKNTARRQELQKKLRELERPIRQRFMDMERRLEGLLTQAQRAGVAEDQKTALANLAAMLGVREDDKPQPEPDRDRSATQPATVEKPKQAPAPEGAAQKPPADPKGGSTEKTVVPPTSKADNPGGGA